LLRDKEKSTAQGDAFLGGFSTWARTRHVGTFVLTAMKTNTDRIGDEFAEFVKSKLPFHEAIEGF
jgi:hypothetical protein